MIWQRSEWLDSLQAIACGKLFAAVAMHPVSAPTQLRSSEKRNEMTPPALSGAPT
jgi:hypothetical protein